MIQHVHFTFAHPFHDCFPGMKALVTIPEVGNTFTLYYIVSAVVAISIGNWNVLYGKPLTQKSNFSLSSLFKKKNKPKKINFSICVYYETFISCKDDDVPSVVIAGSVGTTILTLQHHHLSDRPLYPLFFPPADCDHSISSECPKL